MIIYIRVHQNFQHPQVEHERFSLDVDSQISIEDIKVLITLRYVDLSPEDFELISDTNSFKLRNSIKIHDMITNTNTDDPLQFLMIQRTKKCCCLVF